MARRPLSARLREVAQSLEYTGGEGDREAVLEAAELAERVEQEARESAQTALEVDADGGFPPD